jgi:hypothetical protein
MQLVGSNAGNDDPSVPVAFLFSTTGTQFWIADRDYFIRAFSSTGVSTIGLSNNVTPANQGASTRVVPRDVIWSTPATGVAFVHHLKIPLKKDQRLWVSSSGGLSIVVFLSE